MLAKDVGVIFGRELALIIMVIIVISNAGECRGRAACDAVFIVMSVS